MANRTDFPSSSRVDLSTEEDQKTTEIKERCHSRDLGIEGEEKFEILGGEGKATPENKLQFSSFEDGYEIIEVSDLDRIQIAGFSKQKLLEMCNFCKISYGNNDEKLDSRYKTKAELINEGYGIIPFYYNGRNKRCAGFVFTKDKEITIAYRGTKDFDDVMTDVSAAFTPEFLPKGGKMHNGFYNAFKDSWSSLGRILEDHAKKQLLEIKDFGINCTGHSMGAALATITALYLKKVKSAEHVRVATFGSPRVFDSRGAEIYEKLLGENTIRVTNLSDPIPMFPLGSMGYKHVGEPLKIKTGNFIVNCLVTDLHIVGKYYHKTDTYYGCIQDMKPEDFQPDNDVSRYYYLSYVVAVPYYITTTTLATPYYLFLSAISNTEQRYFEREIELANDRRLMSLKDNKNGPVIHALSNAMGSSKNPLIIPIECNINGRGEGLKFNIYDIASFVNSNYHLNRNNMRLRQLCKTEDVPVKEVPNLISAENHVSGNRNTISDLVNETAVSGQAVNKADDERSQNPKPESQQPQKNTVDKGKNIMDNRNASTKHPISNNYKEGEMHGSDQDTKNIEGKLSESSNVRGVSTTTSDQPVNIDDEKKQVSDQPTAQMPLQMESGSEFEGKDDQRDSPSPKSSANGDEHSSSSSSFVKLPESDTKNSNGEYVKVTSDSSSGSSFEEVGEDENVSTSKSSSPQDTQPGISTSKPSSTGAEGGKEKQTPVQPTGYVEQTGDSGSSNDNNPLGSGTNGEEDSTFKTDEQDTKPAPILEPVPSVANENSGQVNNVQSNGRQSDNQNNKDVQDVSATTSDRITPVSSDTENNKVEKNGVSLQSSGYADNSTILSFVGREHVIHVDAQVSGDVSCLVETISEDTDKVANNHGVLLLEAKPMVQIYDPSGKCNTNLQSAGDSSVGIVSKANNDQLPAGNLEQNSEGVDNNIPVQFVDMTISQSSSASAATLNDDKPPMKDIENDNDPSEEDNDSLPNTKSSNLHIIAASTLAIVGVALGVAIAVHLEMLAAGILVGACYLVAAAVIYHYEWPSSFIENNQIEKVALDEKKGPVATPV